MLALVLSVGLTYTVNAQIRKLPAEVTNSFSEKYPDAKNVEWKDKLSNFSADFEWKDEKYEAHFNKKGDWQNSIPMMSSIFHSGGCLHRQWVCWLPLFP